MSKLLEEIIPRKKQYLLIVFHIRDISFNTFESAVEGMGWKHIPLDVINAVRFVVVPGFKKDRSTTQS